MMRGGLPRLVFALMTARPGAPWLLDLFCGAGGAGWGYVKAGFNIMGVDINPQPRYPGWFIQGDALEFVREFGGMFDLIHASPPCQAYTDAGKQWRMQGRVYADLIDLTRAMLRDTGKPYVIENVPAAAARLNNPLMLCGTMFNLMTTRHRFFECNPPLIFSPFACAHRLPNAKMGRRPKHGKEYIQVMGHFSDVPYARRALGIPWMTQGELAQAVPPAYTHHIGNELMPAVLFAALGGDNGKA